MVAYVVETFETQKIDLTQSASNIELIPARPGYFPVAASVQWLIESQAGTQTTPPTTNAGSDAAHTNFFPSSATTPSNASVNAAAPPSFANAPAQAADTVQRIANATVFLDITAGAQGTGGFALTGKLVVTVFWISVGG